MKQLLTVSVISSGVVSRVVGGSIGSDVGNGTGACSRNTIDVSDVF